MLENVSVLIPYNPNNKDHRSSNFEWVKRFYHAAMPEVEICIGSAADKPFNRCKAINLAAKQASRDVFVIAEADVVYDPELIRNALELLKNHTWIIPFRGVINISEMNSKKLLKSVPGWPLSVEVNDFQIDWYYEEFAGKLNVITRDNFAAAGGCDERFVGWGCEDDAFVCAVNTLCGPFVRIDRPIYHLWHTYAGAWNNPNYSSNWELFEKYRQANGNKDEMHKLVRNFFIP